MLAEKLTARWISPSGEMNTANVTVTPSTSANPFYITLLYYGRMLSSQEHGSLLNGRFQVWSMKSKKSTILSDKQFN